MKTPNGSDPLDVLRQIHKILDGPGYWKPDHLEWIAMAITGAGYVIHDPDDYCHERDHNPPVLLRTDGSCVACEIEDENDEIRLANDARQEPSGCAVPDCVDPSCHARFIGGA